MSVGKTRATPSRFQSEFLARADELKSGLSQQLVPFMSTG